MRSNSKNKKAHIENSNNFVSLRAENLTLPLICMKLEIKYIPKDILCNNYEIILYLFITEKICMEKKRRKVELVLRDCYGMYFSKAI